jgi:hypothetical protein
VKEASSLEGPWRAAGIIALATFRTQSAFAHQAFARLSELRRTSPPVGPLTKPSPDGVSYGERAAHLLGAMTGPRKRAVASKPS